MTEAWTVIVFGHGPDLIRSRDAAVRAVPDGRVIAVERSADFIANLARTVAVARGESVLMIEAGYELLAEGVRGLASALVIGSSAVAGSISVESRDGVHSARWQAGGPSASEVLGDPRAVGPIWASSRELMASVTFDADLPGLEIVDAWLQLIERSGRDATILPELVGRIDASRPSRWHALAASATYPGVFRRLLAKYHRYVDADMTGLLLDREVGFGRLRDRHLELLQRRDQALLELDRLRAETAHHRAFLAHHGLDRLDWGSLDRVVPISRDWGYERGGPVDRRYIREFLAHHSSDVKGHVLEVQEDDLGRAYGGERVDRCDIVDIDDSNPRATVVADLRNAVPLSDAGFDCVILTQTVHVIDEADAVLRECHRILKPGGVLLATFPCVSRVCLEYGPSGDFWRMTPAGARALTARTFGPDVLVETFGNIQTTIGFLHGLGEDEIPSDRYAVTDPYNPTLVGVRARRSPAVGTWGSRRRRGAVLLYHRVGPTVHDPFDLTVTPDCLGEQLTVLQAQATIVDLERLLTAPPESLPEHAVAITFDDGYLEHLTEVAPVLLAQGMPATFFVTSGVLDGDVEHWWDILERARLNDEQRRKLHDQLVAATFEEREALLENLRRSTDAEGPPGRRPLRASELRELAARDGVTIGAHGVHHLLLPRQTKEIRTREMRGCRQSLEAALGRPVPWFAYPYGGVDDETADAARAEFAFCLDCSGTAVRASFDAARVPRLDVKGWSADEFTQRLEKLFAGDVRPPAISFLP